MKLLKAVLKLATFPKGTGALISNFGAARKRNPLVPKPPYQFTIEPTNLCDQRCQVCPTGNKTLRRRKGMMKLDDFKKIIDKIHTYTNSIYFYFMGEPFLNPDSYEMIKYAKEHKIKVISCTNGNYINPQKLIESGIDEIHFQIDGISRDTLGRYRIGAQPDKIISNIQQTVLENKKQKGKTRIVLGFIVMKHNEHELPRVKEFAKRIGIKNISFEPAYVKNIQQANELLPINKKYCQFDKKALTKGKLFIKPRYKNHCHLLWTTAVITIDGDVVPCCFDTEAHYSMGNILHERFEDIWNNEKYISFRKTILNQQEQMAICRNCPKYLPPELY